jgi:hypothetical protein
MALLWAVPLLSAAMPRGEVGGSSFQIDPAFSAERLAAAPSGWPAPDWSTVPTFAFCGPSSRPFRDAPDELQFFAGTNKTRRRPRFYALGYDTLVSYSNASLGFRGSDPAVTGPSQCGGCNDAQAKQLFIAKQVRAVAPDLPIWGGTAYQEMLCDYPKPAPPPPPPCSGVTGHTVCGCAADGGSVVLACTGGGQIKAVAFASVGTPTGTCGNFTAGESTRPARAVHHSVRCVDSGYLRRVRGLRVGCGARGARGAPGRGVRLRCIAPQVFTGAGGDNGFAKARKRREISVGSYHDPFHCLPPHPVLRTHSGKCAGDPAVAKAAVAKLCVGKSSCRVAADINILNGGHDPCCALRPSQPDTPHPQSTRQQTQPRHPTPCVLPSFKQADRCTCVCLKWKCRGISVGPSQKPINIRLRQTASRSRATSR